MKAKATAATALYAVILVYCWAAVKSFGFKCTYDTWSCPQFLDQDDFERLCLDEQEFLMLLKQHLHN